MRTRTFWLSVAAIGCVSGCSVIGLRSREPREVPVHDANTFFETTTIVGASFSADETKILVSSDASGIFNAYRVPVAGGEPVKLTDSKDSVFAVSWFPEDDRFLYVSDQGGNEMTHLYVGGADGAVTDLTPGEKVKAQFVGWSGDRTQFWVATNERDAQFFDLYRYASRGFARERVFTNEESWQVSDVSRDGRWVALGKVRNNVDSDIYLWDSTQPGSKPKHVTPHTGNALHGIFTFSPDSKRLYYSTDAHGEFGQAWTYDLATGRHEPAITADWDVAFVSFSEKGRYRVSGVNADAKTLVTVLDTKTGKEVELPDVGDAEITGFGFSRSESRLAFYVNGDTSPSNLHVLDLKTGGHRLLTRTLNPAIREADLSSGERVRYSSFDGTTIPAILYRPWPASAARPVAALVWVHGGPGGQSTHGYSADIQHLVNHGYAVLAVNNRGSSGYGKTFFHMDDRKHGEGDLKDCVWGRRYLEGLDWVDRGRIGIIGGSYGGFMVAAAVTFEPKAFDAGVDIFGVTNWLRTLQNIPTWWADFREYLYAEMGDPATDEARLRRISPLFHASNIERPLLVIQGANDQRVLLVESDELVAAAKKNGVPVEYVVFPDEGHGFLKKQNRITAARAIVKFLDEHMTGAGARAETE